MEFFLAFLIVWITVGLVLYTWVMFHFFTRDDMRKEIEKILTARGLVVLAPVFILVFPALWIMGVKGV